MATSDVRNLRIVFEVPLKLKISFLNNEIPSLTVARTVDTPLTDLYQYLEDSLSISCKQSLSLLPIGVCKSTYSDNYTRLPLVSEHIWRYLVDDYPFDDVNVILDKRPSMDVFRPPSWIPLRPKEIKLLDVSYYLPEVLDHKHIVSLGEKILHQNYHIKPKLRRGLWMHLLGVFHPALRVLDQREMYIQNLRRVYDNLKGKLGDASTWSLQVRHLRESIQRDAIRTDPSEEFLADPSNMQKLVEIVTVYTLEHSEIKYTQGMTDLLSPILYVMEREDDAYICFAAMFERIKVNFTEWCEGTLNKLERLKHLCEVLDPELFRHLSQQQTEDPFILFFGMVLIECRREFNFEDGLHLLEVLWSAALHRDAPSLQETSRGKWASFMTTVSMEIVYQAFGEIEAPYSTHPLEEDSIDLVMSPRSGSSSSGRSSSSARHIPKPGSAIDRLKEHSINETTSDSFLTINGTADTLSSFQAPVMKRAASLPDNSYVIVNNSCGVKSENDLPKCDSEELQDYVGELVDPKTTKCVPHTTEMADMSSVSSTANSNGQCARNNSITCSGEHTTEPHLPRKSIGDLPITINGDVDHHEGFLHGVLELDDTDDNESEDDRVFDDRDQRKVQTLPRQRRASYNEDVHNFSSTTLPRRTRTSLPPAAFLHHLSRPSLSSPYVSGIRALDPRISYPNTSIMDPFEESTSPCSSPMRLSPFTTSPSCTSNNSLYLPSPLPTFLQTNDTISQNNGTSMEASMEASHAISAELMSSEQAQPNVSRETSLQIRMAEAFSLFVCLAILVQNRHTILSDRLDFVSLSVLLNAQAESQSLPQILKLATQLHRVYYHYQMTYFGKRDSAMFETWLDDPSVVTMATTREI